MIGLMALAASLWLALIVSAPLLPVPLAGVVYVAGSLICHQLPSRSFHISGDQLPVCARCVGIYAGAAAILCVELVLWGGPCRVRQASPTPGFPPRMRGGVAWLAPRLSAPMVTTFGALPTIVTVLLEWAGVWQTSNVIRFAAGIFLGAAVAFVVADAVAKLHYEPCAPQRPIAPRHPPTPI